jgi:hypothetical protein
VVGPVGVALPVAVPPDGLHEPPLVDWMYSSDAPLPWHVPPPAMGRLTFV